ncbi:MAG: 4-hydroxythreonine-4-phosphate dehydrogenase PdxA [Desulfobulbaceae bacterium]|nr:4-hydroxythreonine-4-phosphate dehydrogenase PdxA [Desulfobulbaceae bacterium]
MGCPAGIGPEIILRYFQQLPEKTPCKTVVLGDLTILKKISNELGFTIPMISWQPGTPLPDTAIPVVQLSSLSADTLQWGQPTTSTAHAMVNYIHKGVEYTEQGWLHGIATCPISKAALNSAGYSFPGHTEMLADLTGATDFAMMMAGSSLSVTLATIHCPLSEVSTALSTPGILQLIRTTHSGLRIDFGIPNPRIAVAGLNPHGGENQLFGSEELHIILPAVSLGCDEGIDVSGPFPPDTVFVKASRGNYDAVICMYHDQGLIPFKLLHFDDGVNVTLGLPIVRTSVDHGTAYDIAGKGVANAESLIEAVKLAAEISYNRDNYRSANEAINDE